MSLFPKALASAGAIAFVLAAAGQVAAQAPQKGGSLTYITNGAPQTLDCHSILQSATYFIIMPGYSTLLRWDPDNYPKIVSDLADSWIESADKLSYTFKLHPGVKFHDGSDFTSADVKATYERLRDPPPGVISVRSSMFTPISAIETPDPLTVVFKLAKPYPFFMLAMAQPFNCIYSAKMLAKDPKYPETTVMGTGPYKFVEYVPGSSISWERNPNYFVPGIPHLDKMKGLTISGQGFINANSGTEVDISFASLTPPGMAQIKAARGNNVVFVESANNATQMINVNTTKPPLNDVRVRLAMQYALDRRQGSDMLAKMFPGGNLHVMLPDGSPFEMSAAEMSTLPGFGTDIAANRAKARALLAEAGVKDLKLSMLNRNSGEPYNTLAVFVIDQLRQIGISVEQRLTDTAAYQAGLSGLNFDIAVDANSTTTGDPTEMFIKILPGSGSNYTGANDPVLQELFDKQAVIANMDERKKVIAQFERRVVEQAYILPLFGTTYIGARKPNIMGWKPLPGQAMAADLRNLWIQK